MNHTETADKRPVSAIYRMLFYCAILFHFYFSMFHNFSLLCSHISECFNLGNCWMSEPWEKEKISSVEGGEALEYNVMALMNIQHNNLHVKELKLYQGHFSDCIKLLERKFISLKTYRRHKVVQIPYFVYFWLCPSVERRAKLGGGGGVKRASQG